MGVTLTDFTEPKTKDDKKDTAAKERASDLAKKHSLLPNASEGGNLGLFDINNFAENIKEIISGLNKGNYSNVISTTQGFQIF